MYFFLMFLMGLLFLELTAEELKDLKPNSIFFGIIWYTTLSFFLTLFLLSLNLVFSYNSFLVGYTQSLFFFIFIFLSYTLFRLFTKGTVLNSTINLLVKH